MYIFLDTETTGLEESDRLCQLAFSFEGEQFESLFDPKVPITIGAMATHHITEKMIVGKEVFAESEMKKKLIELIDKGGIVVAHNAKFDIGFLAKEGIEVKDYICTMKLAQYLDKEGVVENYAMQFLRYYMGIEIKATAHDALGDIIVLEKVFDRLKSSIEKECEDAKSKMIEITMNPLLLNKMPFGKHKGMKFSEVPKDYLRWLSGTDIEGDLKYTVDNYLNAGKLL